MIIREAVNSDREQLALLFTDLADEQLDDIGIVFDTRPVLPEHAEAILGFLKAQGGFMFIAEIKGSLCGFLLLSKPEIHKQKRFTGLTMAVAGDHREKGIGKALLSNTQERVMEKGLTEIRLTVRRHNQPAVHLYKKYGFEIIEETETDYKMRWQNPDIKDVYP